MNSIIQGLQDNWLLIVVVVIGIPVGWVVMRYMGRKSPKRVQSALLVTEDNRIVPVDLPVELGCVVKHKWRQAWLMCPEIMVRKRGTLVNWLFLDERDASPQAVCPDAETRKAQFDSDENDKEGKNPREFDRIGMERGEEAVNGNVTRQDKDKSGETVQMIALILAVLFVVVITFLAAANKFHWGA